MTRDSQRRVGLLLVATLTVMSTGFVSTSMPAMAEHFRDAPHAALYTKLILTMPALVIAICAPFAGAIVDRFGRVNFLRGSLVLFGFAGTAGFWLQELEHVLASRALLGIAIGGSMTTMTTLAGDYFQGEARSRFTGVQSLVMSLGAVVAVGIGGLLAEISWRLPFLIYGAAWIFLVPVIFWLDEPRHAEHRVAGTVASQRMPVGAIAAIYATTFFAVAMFYMTSVQVPFLTREIGIGATSLAGLAIAVSSLASASTSFLYHRVRRDFGFVRIYAISFGLMAIGYGVIALVGTYPAILLGMLLSGLGVGLFFPNGTLWAVSVAPAAVRGRVSGGLTAAVFLGQFFSPIVTEPAVNARGIVGAFGVFALVLAIVAVIFTLVREPRTSRRIPA